MATFLEIAALSVYHMFSLYLVNFFVLPISHFGSEERILDLVVTVPGHRLPFTLVTLKFDELLQIIFSNWRIMFYISLLFLFLLTTETHMELPSNREKIS